jgi:hypothetical protein
MRLVKRDLSRIWAVTGFLMSILFIVSIVAP